MRNHLTGAVNDLLEKLEVACRDSLPSVPRRRERCSCLGTFPVRGESARQGVHESGLGSRVKEMRVAFEDPAGTRAIVGHDWSARGKGLDVHVAERFIQCHVQEDIGGAVHVGHPAVRKRASQEPAGEQFGGESVDVVAQRSVSGHQEESFGHPCNGPYALQHALVLDERADHEDQWPILGQPESGPVAGTRMERGRIESVGDESGEPSFAVARVELWIRADEAVAREETVLPAPLVRRPFWVTKTWAGRRVPGRCVRRAQLV
jgi:hypothetical protein